MSESRASARQRLAAQFAAAGLDSANVDARLLVGDVAGTDHAGLIRDPDLCLDDHQASRLTDHSSRRLRREPVSRILGHREFWGLDFTISPDVLDPRPETEGLVASVLDAIGGQRDVPYQILDLGTGSGAILGALLTELPRSFGLGIDRAEGACRVARRNLSRLGLGERFAVVCADWTEAIAAPFEIVVSNPPYIATKDMEALDPEVRSYDPRAALDGGADGLTAFRSIVPALGKITRTGAIVALECGSMQGAKVSAMMVEPGFAGASVYKDLAGHDRVVIATLGARVDTTSATSPCHDGNPVNRGRKGLRKALAFDEKARK